MMTRRTWASFAAAATLIVVAIGCGGSPTAPETVNVPYAQTDLTVGTGAEAASGRRVTVNYTGWLYSTSAAENKGTQFDTSIGRGPFVFTLGLGQVITGWDRGLLGMKVGGRRRLVLPPSFAYGSSGSGAIPPNATLVFDIELLAVE